jgi:hypothetical protein
MHLQFFETNVQLDLRYQFIKTKSGTTILDAGLTNLPQNLGNNFIARIGRHFYPELLVGYEYYFSDFKYTLPLYYSPQDFNQHSLYAEWKVFKDIKWDILLAGKLGYIPQNDYIVRELSGHIYYNFTETFRVLLTGFISSSYRDETGYTSGSISLSALWSIY